MKKFLFVIGLFLMIGLVPVSAKEKVKVYVFEAGGCPYCEQQYKYFESLSDYNVTFEVIKKELYVDHIEWQPGADYDLGVKVAKAFNEKNYVDASYQGTPFVVISDIYAASMFNTDLEKVIKEAYEEGDNDVVGCLAKSDDCEIRRFRTATEKEIDALESHTNTHLIILYILVGALVVYSGFITYKLTKNTEGDLETKKQIRLLKKKKK